MAQHNAIYTLTTPAATITFNSGTDKYFITDIDGLDGAPIRAPMDNRPLADGGLIHPFFLGPRQVTIRGVILIDSQTTESGYVTQRNTMEANLLTALNSILRADGTLGWTPTGLSARSLTVRNDEPCRFAGTWIKDFIFGLVAGNPNY
jgi:hypothetical protein